MVDYKITDLDADLDFDQLPYWDVVIIGAGPAGLAAGLTTAHRGLTTLIIEAKDKPAGSHSFCMPKKESSTFPDFRTASPARKFRKERTGKPSMPWSNFVSTKSCRPSKRPVKPERKIRSSGS